MTCRVANSWGIVDASRHPRAHSANTGCRRFTHAPHLLSCHPPHLHRVAVDDDLLGARLAPAEPLLVRLLARQHTRVAARSHHQPADTQRWHHAAAWAARRQGGRRRGVCTRAYMCVCVWVGVRVCVYVCLSLHTVWACVCVWLCVRKCVFVCE